MYHMVGKAYPQGGYAAHFRPYCVARVSFSLINYIIGNHLLVPVGRVGEITRGMPEYHFYTRAAPGVSEYRFTPTDDKLKKPLSF